MAQALGFLSAHQLRRNKWGEGMGNFASHLWWAKVTLPKTHPALNYF